MKMLKMWKYTVLKPAKINQPLQSTSSPVRLEEMVHVGRRYILYQQHTITVFVSGRSFSQRLWSIYNL